MSRRWKWDFEEERAATPPPSPPALSAPGRTVLGPPVRRRRGGAQIRRRRSGAALLLLGLVVAVIVALTGSSPRATRSHGGPAAASALPGGASNSAAPSAEAEGAAAVKRVLAYTPFVRTGGGQSKDIALTFDDGPGPYTPEVLSVLERFHVHATFFAIGKMERYFSASTIREFQDGDVVGDHTQSHPQLAQLSAHEQHEELFEGLLRIEVLGGDRPSLFRPPYGSYNATTMRQLRALHLLMVLWSADTQDYLQPGVPVIVQRALEGAQPGAILLMHDGGGNRTQTIAALPTIITKLRERGYHLVTVPEMLAKDPPPAGQPLPANLAGD
ncbi:MAG TPA: polysaccharide deacetylase family protein [Solirubrobacteraceae bacterium]|jgi:peptidoglycan/xylan/chitin deacetylase (PgdA/CDA1 family)|nr:polysaccharide deacetylase family protein [Solirubrobacteraceae bacterium]